MNGALFRDRRDAGRQLGARLAAHRGTDVLVVGVPRGGVAVAAEVARALDADLDVVVARKLGAPGAAELAIGAVTADGARVLNYDVIDSLGVPADYVEGETAAQLVEARRRVAWLRQVRPAARIRDRVTILVDDGLATGATVRAAVHSLRTAGAARVIVAVPVGAREACAEMAAVADDVVCLHQPEPFGAIGWYYADFAQVSDDEVRALLETPQPAPIAG